MLYITWRVFQPFGPLEVGGSSDCCRRRASTPLDRLAVTVAKRSGVLAAISHRMIEFLPAL
jgi:hypothetical protein